MWFVAAAAAIAFVGFLALGTSDPTSDSAQSIYDFALAEPDGTITSLDINRGQPMVVNYFAAWCGPCRRELPDFEAVHQRLGDDVAIVGVSRDNTTSAWLTLVESTGLTYDTFFEGNVTGSYDFVKGLAMPTTAFVSAEGELVYSFSGPLNEDSLTELIDEHLLNPVQDG